MWFSLSGSLRCSVRDMWARPGALGLIAVTLALTLIGAACGSDGKGSATSSTTLTTTTGTGRDARTRASGRRLQDHDHRCARRRVPSCAVTWNANFAPDFSKNHIHVYWDKYTADQVSDDAAKRGVKQGEWVPTDDYPEYVTEGRGVDKRVREGSSTRFASPPATATTT